MQGGNIQTQQTQLRKTTKWLTRKQESWVILTATEVSCGVLDLNCAVPSKPSLGGQVRTRWHGNTAYASWVLDDGKLSVELDWPPAPSNLSTLRIKLRDQDGRLVIHSRIFMLWYPV
jgi:hypothetical protein